MADTRTKPPRGVGLAAKGYRVLKPCSAKEDTESYGCLGKLLGCHKMDEQRIAVRTKWQSGNRKKCAPLKGNRFFGDDKAGARESLPDLSRKLYSVHYPIYIFI